MYITLGKKMISHERILLLGEQELIAHQCPLKKDHCRYILRNSDHLVAWCFSNRFQHLTTGSNFLLDQNRYIIITKKVYFMSQRLKNIKI